MQALTNAFLKMFSKQTIVLMLQVIWCDMNMEMHVKMDLHNCVCK
jgi:hypothetical protein